MDLEVNIDSVAQVKSSARTRTEPMNPNSTFKEYRQKLTTLHLGDARSMPISMENFSSKNISTLGAFVVHLTLFYFLMKLDPWVNHQIEHLYIMCLAQLPILSCVNTVLGCSFNI